MTVVFDAYGTRYQVCRTCKDLLPAPIPMFWPQCGQCTTAAKIKEIGHLFVAERKTHWRDRLFCSGPALTARQRAYMLGHEPVPQMAPRRVRRAPPRVLER